MMQLGPGEVRLHLAEPGSPQDSFILNAFCFEVWRAGSPRTFIIRFGTLLHQNCLST
jgi:hypothetical protein